MTEKEKRDKSELYNVMEDNQLLEEMRKAKLLC